MEEYIICPSCGYYDVEIDLDNPEFYFCNHCEYMFPLDEFERWSDEWTEEDDLEYIGENL